MVNLIHGIKKFQTQVFPHMRDEFAQLQTGQSPETLFITCSDSRVDPSLITQTNPGELFVIRNAGNIVPRPGVNELSVEASIQFAVEILNVSQIVVCGHSHCGAVGALMDLAALDGRPAIREWVNNSKRVLAKINSGENRLSDAIALNALLQLEHLREYPCVAKAIEEDSLKLHAWVYHFESGHVDFLNDIPVAFG